MRYVPVMVAWLRPKSKYGEAQAFAAHIPMEPGAIPLYSLETPEDDKITPEEKASMLAEADAIIASMKKPE